MNMNKGHSERNFFLAFLVVLVIAGVFFFVSKNNVVKPQPQTTNAPKVITPQTSLLIDAAVWYPSAPWTEPREGNQATFYGNLSGELITAQITSPAASIDHFEDVSALKTKGFLPDNNLSADGPGSSSWGYKKTENGKSQIFLFGYQTEASSNNPNQPLQFNCPCKVNITVFASKPF